jgi:hypothetical protein
VNKIVRKIAQFAKITPETKQDWLRPVSRWLQELVL